MLAGSFYAFCFKEVVFERAEVGLSIVDGVEADESAEGVGAGEGNTGEEEALFAKNGVEFLDGCSCSGFYPGVFDRES